MEARHRETARGDHALNFDLTSFDALTRHDLDTETVRVGGHYAVAPNLSMIGSAIYLHEFQTARDPSSEDKTTTEGFLGEAQVITKSDRLSIIAGAGYYGATLETEHDFEQSHGNGYLYAYGRYPANLQWTIGISFDSLYSDMVGTIEHVTPKFGLQWSLTKNTIVRGAIFRILNRPLPSDQTIEPTQVAGFNQFFDDFNGTESLRYAIAIDHRFGSAAFLGFEASERQLYQPLGPADTFPLEEDLYRAYLYWTPHRNVAFNAEWQMELFESNDLFNTRTQLAPFGIRFFHPCGFLGQLDAIYVDQTVADAGDDQFLTVNAGVGYRLPKRYGILQFSVRNVFDTDFNYQDTDTRTATMGDTPAFVPERAFLAQFILAF